MIGNAAIETVKIRHLIRHVMGACVPFVAALALSASAPNAAPTPWVRVEHDALRGGGHVVYVNDILPADGFGNPWLAVGFVVDGDGNRDPSAWTSPNGVTWRRVSMESTGSLERRDGPLFVARRGNVAVAVGQSFNGQLRTAAWRSTGSGRWSAVRDPSDPIVAFPGTLEALDVGPIGFVAVGVQHFTNESTVTVFRSTDGQAWQVFTAFTTQSGDGFQPLDVSAASDRIVIVGDSAVPSRIDGRIWVVEKNGTFSRTEPAPIGLDGAGLQQVAGIAWHPSLGFVAGGVTNSLSVEVPTLWSSPDGLDWKRLPAGAPPLDGGRSAIHRVIATASGFVASGDSETGPRIWRSSNGHDWTAIPPPPSPGSGGRLVNVASDGTKIVLAIRGPSGSQVFHRLGSSWKRGDTGPAFPTSSPVAAELHDLAAEGKHVVAVGNDGYERPLVMLSTGAARVWRKASFPDRAARLMAITSDRGVFTAAGWRLVRGRARLALWTSRTGLSWRRLGGTANEPIGVFVDIAPSPSGLVAVALEPSRRGFVTSVWMRDRGVWRSATVLGPGEASAICSGPHGTTAIATIGVGPRSKVLAWTRLRGGPWSREPELIAAAASANRCADGAAGTVVVGSDENGGAVAWRRSRPDMPWRASVVAQTAPQSTLNEVVRDGPGYLATGTSGGRGQADLAVWKSLDGVRWTRIGGVDPVFAESGFQAGLGLVRTRGRIVIVGRHGAGNAGLWVGSDSTATNAPGP